MYSGQHWKEKDKNDELKYAFPSRSALRMGADLIEPPDSAAATAQNSDAIKKKHILSGREYSSHLLNRALGESAFQR